MKTETMIKKQYVLPDCFFVACAAEDVISTSSYAHYDEGDGEWLNWKDLNRSR